MPLSLKEMTIARRCDAAKGKPGRRLRLSASLHACSNVCTPNATYSGQKTSSHEPDAVSSRLSRFHLKAAERVDCIIPLKWPIRGLIEVTPIEP
eukprot:scaffold232314_cov32-Tisochrysis_lutea.AAC.5